MLFEQKQIENCFTNFKRFKEIKLLQSLQATDAKINKYKQQISYETSKTLYRVFRIKLIILGRFRIQLVCY